MSNTLDKLKGFWPKKWPSKKQWKKLPEVLVKKEKILLCFLVVAVVVSFLYTTVSLYYEKTEVVPAYGGSYREGFIQSTRWMTINPIYASQSDTERDIIEVVFDGLMRFDKEGELVPHLAEKYTTEDNRVFTLLLREDIYWSDGEKITADDVIFTVKTIQNPDFQSTLRQQWAGVKTEKISGREIRFTLDNPSTVFLENLTLKIIPEHIFENLSPRDFRYSEYNMNPVGSGPYRFREVRKNVKEEIESIFLERNPYYFKPSPFLDEVSFHFFGDVEALLRAQTRGRIDGFALSDGVARDFPLEEVRGFTHYEFTLPRFFPVLFNLQSEEATGDVNIRRALSYGTNKEEIIEKVLGGKGKTVSSPLLLDFYGLPLPEESYPYNLEKAREILKEEGFEDGKKQKEDPFSFTEDLKDGSKGEEVRNLQRCFLHLSKEDEELYPQGEVTGFFDESTKEAVNYFQEKYKEEILDPHGFTSGTGMVAESTREKLNELCEEIFKEAILLEVSITTIDDPMLIKTAEVLGEQWDKLGVETEVVVKSSLELREDTIRPREFQALLFGIMFTDILNPFPLWHSTRVEDPGLNLIGYKNEQADALLEKIITGEEKEESLLELQEVIMEDAPGIFLYNPHLIYSVSERVKGIQEGLITNPSKRFENINEWHINARRVLRK